MTTISTGMSRGRAPRSMDAAIEQEAAYNPNISFHVPGASNGEARTGVNFGVHPNLNRLGVDQRDLRSVLHAFNMASGLSSLAGFGGGDLQHLLSAVGGLSRNGGFSSPYQGRMSPGYGDFQAMSGGSPMGYGGGGISVSSSPSYQSYGPHSVSTYQSLGGAHGWIPAAVGFGSQYGHHQSHHEDGKHAAHAHSRKSSRFA